MRWPVGKVFIHTLSPQARLEKGLHPLIFRLLTNLHMSNLYAVFDMDSLLLLQGSTL